MKFRDEGKWKKTVRQEREGDREREVVGRWKVSLAAAELLLS
jgi:hypothetical protein